MAGGSSAAASTRGITLPPAFDRLQGVADAAWERFLAALPDPLLQQVRAYCAADARLHGRLVQGLAISEFLLATVTRLPRECVPGLLAPFPSLDAGSGALTGRLLARQCAEPVGADPTVDRAVTLRLLRQFRAAEQARLAFTAVTAEAPLERVSAGCTALAEASIGIATALALRPHRGSAALDFGVVGMGKLGGSELNLSSDVDLLFLRGDESAAAAAEANRIARDVIDLLDRRTEDGIVFRVDVRLRPYGNAGALVPTLAQLDDYFHAHGRPWERYAMLKARPLFGSPRLRTRFEQQAEDFVFRDYIDHGAVEGLRDVGGKLRAEARRRRLDDDVKLGPGGIREAEFTVQLAQLTYAARHPTLKVRGFLPALTALRDSGRIDATAAAELSIAYRFLRRFEHVLQAVRDQQTQRLPQTELDWQRSALALGMAGSDALKLHLDQHRQAVRYYFEQQLEAPVSSRIPPVLTAPVVGEQGLADRIEVPDGSSVPRLLARLQERAPQQPDARRNLDRFLPLALATAAQMSALAPPADPRAPVRVDAERALALERLLEFVDAVRGRTVYLAQLVEHPGSLRLLLELFGRSGWIAQQLRASPRLLDDLRDSRALLDPLDRRGLANRFRARLTRDGADEELLMEALRELTARQKLSIAASELRGLLPLTRASDYLVELAEVVLQMVLESAWHDLAERHGTLPGAAGSDEAQLLVVGFGKLGGQELGYDSDLDIVFLHPDLGSRPSSGQRPLGPEAYLVRTAQKMIHRLTTRTYSGALYEVDTRLRPSGRAGTMVSSLAAFRRYQLQDAWTWEHQALVRARPVAGPAALAAEYLQIRREVLTRQRDADAVRADVRAMRLRMLQANRRPLAVPDRDSAGASGFDRKQDRGGIVDIEFVVQYLAVARGHDFPELCAHHDTLRLLETAVDCGLLDAGVGVELAAAYRQLRADQHERILTGAPGSSASTSTDDAAAADAGLWALRGRVAAVFDEMIGPTAP